MNKFLNIACCSLAILVASCSEEVVQVDAPAFERGEHVDNCLPALYALDVLAEAEAGSQAGERVAMAPWLRIDYQTITYRDSVNLTAASLGPVIMPMLALAQKGLSAEVAALSQEQIDAWQSEFSISRDAASFAEYCSREAAFAQWRDAKNTIPWLLALTLEEHKPNWFQKLFGGSSSDVALRAEPLAWKTYFDVPLPSTRVTLVKDLNGLPMVADVSAIAMLDRYSPRWNIPVDSAFLLGSVNWKDGLVALNDEAGIYGYIDYGVAMDKRFTRLNYLSLWSDGDDIVGYVYRISVGFNGRPFAYEIMNMAGSQYNLYIAQGLEASNLPSSITAQEVKAQPVMGIFFDEAMTLAEVRSSSGTTEQSPLTILEFDQLLNVSSASGTKSVFDKDGVLLSGGSYSGFKSWLSGIPKVGLPRHPQGLVVDTDRQLNFSSPDLLTQFGLKIIEETP